MSTDKKALSPPWAGDLSAHLPPEARAVYGARWIITRQGAVDVVWDRCGFVDDGTPEGADDRRLLSDVLTEDVGEGVAERLVADLLRSRAMNTHMSGVFSLHSGPRCWMIADPRGSAGYLYVAAWLRPEA